MGGSIRPIIDIALTCTCSQSQGSLAVSAPYPIINAGNYPGKVSIGVERSTKENTCKGLCGEENGPG
jgi:hypothetical protein